MTAPDSADVSVSVVVPTYNGGERLRRCVQALLQQERPAHEIIIVDDGSPQAPDWLDEEVERQPSLRLLRQENAGPAAARNRGWHAASGQIVAFTDDDCLPAPGWLAGICESLGAQPDAPAAYGRILATGDRTPLAHFVENEGAEHQTANAAFRRSVLDRLGGFDERFRHPYLEDTELYYRVLELGEPVFAKEALVEHPTRPGTLAGRLRRVRYYAADFLLHRQHPERYHERRNGCGPTRYLLYYVALKHGLATAVHWFPSLFRHPMQYLELILTLILERVVLLGLLVSGTLQREADGHRPR